MEALLALMMEDRQATRAESAAAIAALQQLAAAQANNNKNNGNGARAKLKDFQQTNPPVFSKMWSLSMLMTGSVLLGTTLK